MHMEPLQTLFAHDEPVAMYEVNGSDVEQEANSALQSLEEIADRLSRLRLAYGEWKEFDAGAYFDLTHAQTNRLVRVSERVSTVHVTFYADLLLPSFHAVESCWYDVYCPTYWRMIDGLRTGSTPAEAVDRYSEDAQPEMIERWHKLSSVVQQTRTEAIKERDYLIAYLSLEETARWAREWRKRPVRSIADELLPSLQSLSTLTLATEFPLPAGRQPGRLRRLRTNRERGRPQRFVN